MSERDMSKDARMILCALKPEHLNESEAEAVREYQYYVKISGEEGEKVSSILYNNQNSSYEDKDLDLLKRQAEVHEKKWRMAEEKIKELESTEVLSGIIRRAREQIDLDRQAKYFNCSFGRVRVKRSVTKRGDSVDEAVQKALRELNIPRDRVTISVINEGKKGFLGIGKKDAEVKVTEL